MKKYLIYLSKNPGKIVYHVFILTFYTLLNHALIINWNTSTIHKAWMWVLLLGFDLVLLPLALLQPVNEYKRGKKEAERAELLKKQRGV